MKKVLGSLAVLASFLGLTSLSAGEGPWVRHSEAVKSRIVVANIESARDGMIMAAWEAELADGWKTYWRSPGEAGLPIDVYVDQTEVDAYYPLPERFELFDIQTYGYAGQLTLPFEVDLEKVRAGVDLKVEFMVCKDICIPFKQSYTLDTNLVQQSSPLVDIRMAAWLKKVPQRGQGEHEGLDIKSVRISGRAGYERLVVDVMVKEMDGKPDLLVEAGDRFQFGEQKVRSLPTPGLYRIVTPVLARKDTSLRDRALRLTLSDGLGHAIDRIIKQ